MKLYEIEPGTWIVPDLVYHVQAEVEYMNFTYSVKIHSLLSNVVVVVRAGNGRVESLKNEHIQGNTVHYACVDDIGKITRDAAAEIAAWINERRSEGLEMVRAS